MEKRVRNERDKYYAQEIGTTYIDDLKILYRLKKSYRAEKSIILNKATKRSLKNLSNANSFQLHNKRSAAKPYTTADVTRKVAEQAEKAR